MAPPPTRPITDGVAVYSVKLLLRDSGRPDYKEVWTLSNSGRMFVRDGSHPIG